MSRILIIDDDQANRDILRTRLELAGHLVTEAPNGEEGLRLSESADMELVFLDVMMPRVDGLQVCRQIKANPKTKNVPVVLLTACDQKIDQLRGWESGADDYLAKPWNPAQVLEVVNKWCGSPHAETTPGEGKP